MGYKESRDCRSSSASHAQGWIQANNSEPFIAGLKTPWSELYRAQTERLSRIAAEMGVPPDRIAVGLQEVWLDLIQRRKDFRGEDAEQRLCAWLGVVVRSKSRNMLRRLKWMRAEFLNDMPAELVDCKADDPAQRMTAKERDECVAAALEELRKKEPLNCRLVREHIMEGRSLAELAAETGLRIHAISCRIGRTLKKLRPLLREWRPDAGAEKRSVPKARRRKK